MSPQPWNLLRLKLQLRTKGRPDKCHRGHRGCRKNHWWPPTSDPTSSGSVTLSMDDGLYLASCLAVLALCIISYWKIRETYVAARTPLGMYPTKHSIPWPHLTGQCQHIQDLSQSWNPSALTRFINLINPDLPYSAIQADWFHPIDAMPPIFSRRNSHCTLSWAVSIFSDVGVAERKVHVPLAVSDDQTHGLKPIPPVGKSDFRFAWFGYAANFSLTTHGSCWSAACTAATSTWSSTFNSTGWLDPGIASCLRRQPWRTLRRVQGSMQIVQEAHPPSSTTRRVTKVTFPWGPEGKAMQRVDKLVSQSWLKLDSKIWGV